MASLLLDTCALIWITTGAPLSDAAIRALRVAASQEDGIAISPISAWEIGMLMSRGRLALAKSPRAWMATALEQPNTVLARMPPEVLIESFEIEVLDIGVTVHKKVVGRNHKPIENGDVLDVARAVFEGQPARDQHQGQSVQTSRIDRIGVVELDEFEDVRADMAGENFVDYYVGSGDAADGHHPDRRRRGHHT